MNTRLKKQKGFTLIEILVVVVILGILASIILPRLLAQTERANIAEGQQMLGAIRTAQTRTMDLSQATGYLVLVNATAQDWINIGLTAPAAGKYTYACTAGTTACTATRVAGPAASITLNLAGAWTCAGTYTAATPATAGCQQ